MGFIKIANNKMTIEALNSPKDWDIFNLPRKITEASIDKSSDLNGYNLKEAVTKHPDNLFVKVFAIKANEINDNGDFFSTNELRKGASTFVGCPIFCNHQNNDIEKARGECVHAWFDDAKDGIYIIARVDKVAYPKLARGIEEGYITGTSMGCAVDYSCCSICHNSAKSAEEYCEHVAHRKNRKFSGKVECRYHSSKEKPEGPCLVCGAKKGESKTLIHEAEQIHEKNFGIKFIEDSFVVNPACHDCLIDSILYSPGVLNKVAELKEINIKLADQYKEFECSTGSCSLTKTAGKKELILLAEAMDNIEKVAKSILAQKNQVDIEYVQSLVDTMKTLQDTQDDLLKQGYAQLPSPAFLDQLSNVAKASGIQPPMQPATQPVAQPEVPVKNSSNPTAASTPKSQDIGGLGSVSMPKSSENNLDIKKDFLIDNSNIKESAVNAASEKQINGDIDIKNIDKELKTAMTDNKNEKLAGIGENPVGSSEQGETTTESQLNSANLKQNPRKDAPDQISEAQLGGKEEGNQTSTESLQVRKASTPDQVTEAQLEALTGEELVRMKNTPDQITEAQWTEASRAVRAKLSADWNTSITESQLRDLLSSHTFVNSNDLYATITEDQLKNLSSGMKRWANKEYVGSVVKVASNAIVEAIVNFGKTSKEIAKVASVIADDSKIKDKVAFVTLINSLPYKNREVNNSEFNKIASVNEAISDIDALSMSVSNNSVFGVKVDDVFDVIGNILSDKTAMAKIAEQVVSKNNQKKATVDKQSMIKEAIALASRPEDGIYRIEAEIAEIGADPKNKKAFIEAAKKFAQAEIGSQAPVIVLKIQIDPQGGGAIMDVTPEDMASEEMIAADKDMNFNGMADGGEESAEIGVDNLDNEIEVIDNGMGSESSDDEVEIEIEEEEHAGETPGEAAVHEENETPEEEAAEHKEFGEEESEEKEEKECSSCEGGNVDPMKQDRMTARANSRAKLTKEAQFGMPGGDAGTPGQPMAGAGAPGMAAGAGAGAAGQPGLESLQTQGTPDEFAGESEDMSAQPPGSLCPVCGSSDLDVIHGKGKCNNCTSEFIFKIDIEVVKWSGLTGDEDEEGSDEAEGEGFEMPTETATPAESGNTGLTGAASAGDLQFALYTKIRPEVIEKVASVINTVKAAKDEKEIAKITENTGIRMSTLKKMASNGYNIGNISPITGTYETTDLGSELHRCLDTGSKYEVKVAADLNDEKNIHVQWVWKPEETFIPCDECNRAKLAFAKALKEANVDIKDFADLKGDDEKIKRVASAVLNIKKAGLVKNIKTAAASGDILGKYKVAYKLGENEKFPIENLRDLLGRMYGSNAVALSGPCEGKNLIECVSKAMKNAGVYSNNIVTKLASVWMQTDGCEDCVQHQYELGFSVKDASAICDTLKNVYASDEEVLAEKFAQIVETDTTDMPPTDGPGTDGGMPSPADDMGGEDVFGDTANMSEQSDGTVTIELPVDIAEQLSSAVETAVAEKSPEISENKEGELGDNIESLNNDGIAGNVEEIPGEPEVNDMQENVNNGGQYVEGNEPVMASTDDVETIVKEAGFMRSSFGRVGQMNLDIASIAKKLNIKTSADKKVVEKRVQDETEQIGQYSNGETLGHESETVRDAKALSVPKDDQRLGGEKNKEKLQPNKELLPTIPSAGAEAGMGSETEKGYTSDSPVAITGGLDGAGASEGEKAASNNYKTRLSSLADRVLANLKQADQKKVQEPKAVSEDSDLGKIQGDSTMGNEAKTVAKGTDLDKSKLEDNQVMGNEQEVLGGKKMETLEIAADNQVLGQETNKPEKQTNTKGTVIASGNTESQSRTKEATRVAGSMLEAGMIKVADLHTKIAELSRYEISQIKDIENSMFRGKKGFAAASGGLEKPVIIDENKSTRLGSDEMKQKFASLFSLSHQCDEAESIPDFALRRASGRK